MKFSVATVAALAAAAYAQVSNSTLATTEAPVTSAAPIESAENNGTELTTGTVSIIKTETNVVTAYTTYCPYPTEIVEGNKTYTVTEATTLTITDCPCTRTTTVVTETITTCPVSEFPTEPITEGPKPTESKPVVPVPVVPVESKPAPSPKPEESKPAPSVKPEESKPVESKPAPKPTASKPEQPAASTPVQTQQPAISSGPEQASSANKVTVGAVAAIAAAAYLL
ncbi:YALIA101S05e08086g1_1 [Yarrowia lipolytica]|nr:Hypothetical protein YALI2_E01606g [Yarrowia lipolytica]SEI34678.1 YALIA101S05e08086g1_1 [Yarrowia lipolytica]VBB78990.1 Conserved hypothetical protein [Yarrowia lipolytica]